MCNKVFLMRLVGYPICAVGLLCGPMLFLARVTHAFFLGRVRLGLCSPVEFFDGADFWCPMHLPFFEEKVGLALRAPSMDTRVLLFLTSTPILFLKERWTSHCEPLA